ncbi:MAG TPA: hypothetical protein VF254_08685 [Gammaproteobacteria bacterium]
MTTDARNEKLFAYSFIVAGFVLEIAACVLMLLIDGPDSVPPGVLMLIAGMGLLFNGIRLLQKQQQG